MSPVPPKTPLQVLAETLFPQSNPPIFAAPVIQDRWYKDQTIHIDGYTFERCRFDRCRLLTAVGTFAFRQCYISPDCSVFFDGAGLKVARLVMHQLAMHGRVQELPTDEGIFPTLNADGTWS